MNLNIAIKFSDRTIQKYLDYPQENEVRVEFNDITGPITVGEITLNGIHANIYHNTQFHFENSDTTITSVHTITKNGVYVLKIDDLYIRSTRSGTWHCSNDDPNFVFTYEFTRSSFVDTYRDRNHIGFDNEFIPCFGCSFTYGAGQPDTSAWPYLLAKKTGKNFLNLGTASSGVDGVYNNMCLLYQERPFDQCIILVPPFERRMVKAKIGDVYLRLCSNVDLSGQKSSFHFYNDPGLRRQMISVQQQIVDDIRNEYSTIYFDNIVHFCNSKKIDLYCSAWTKQEYEFLKQKQGFNLLPAFPQMNIFQERATDGSHPHEKHYRLFVDQITTASNFP
jgi:hypothetical protein